LLVLVHYLRDVATPQPDSRHSDGQNASIISGCSTHKKQNDKVYSFQQNKNQIIGNALEIKILKQCKQNI